MTVSRSYPSCRIHGRVAECACFRWTNRGMLMKGWDDTTVLHYGT